MRRRKKERKTNFCSSLMKLFAAHTLGGPNNYENFIGKPRRAGGEAFLEIGNANGSK